MSKLFDELMESVQQMDEILRRKRQSSRESPVDALQAKENSKDIGMTQANKGQPL